MNLSKKYLYPLLLIFLPPALSAEVDFSKAIETALQAKGYQAIQYSTHTEVFEKDKLLVSQDLTLERTKQENGVEWLETESSLKGDKEEIISIGFNIKEAPEELLSGYQNPHLVKKEEIASIPCEHWQVTDEEDEDCIIDVWIKEENNQLHMIQIPLEESNLAYSCKLKLQIFYREHDSIPLPYKTELEGTGKSFFYKRFLKISTVYNNWKRFSTEEN